MEGKAATAPNAVVLSQCCTSWFCRYNIKRQHWRACSPKLLMKLPFWQKSLYCEYSTQVNTFFPKLVDIKKFTQKKTLQVQELLFKLSPLSPFFVSTFQSHVRSTNIMESATSRKMQFIWLVIASGKWCKQPAKIWRKMTKMLTLNWWNQPAQKLFAENIFSSTHFYISVWIFCSVPTQQRLWQLVLLYLLGFPALPPSNANRSSTKSTSNIQPTNNTTMLTPSHVRKMVMMRWWAIAQGFSTK